MKRIVHSTGRSKSRRRCGVTEEEKKLEIELEEKEGLEACLR
jgi:hypothetical protein